MDLSQQLLALGQVILIDLVLAGDNAIVVGLAASRVQPELRAKVILWGVGAAVVMRIFFAAVATQLLTIVGLTFAGGILLLWVCWKMFREIQHASHVQEAMAGGPSLGEAVAPLGFWAAISQIMIADLSMSLDNVLAVAGAAKGDMLVLVIGLTFAVVFMGAAATYIARLLARYPWISWIGLLIILHVAIEMLWKGGHQVGCQFVPQSVCNSGFLATLDAIF